MKQHFVNGLQCPICLMVFDSPSPLDKAFKVLAIHLDTHKSKKAVKLLLEKE